MANQQYINPNILNSPQPQTTVNQQSVPINYINQTPVQYPYGGNNMLLTNSPYENYMNLNRQQQPQNYVVNQFLKCRPVASKEQARAFQIDLDGSLWVFTDVGNGKIYTKQISPDGTAKFNTYVLTQQDENVYNNAQYVTKEEFDTVIQSLVAAMQSSNTQQPNQAASTDQSNQVSHASVLNF